MKKIFISFIGGLLILQIPLVANSAIISGTSGDILSASINTILSADYGGSLDPSAVIDGDTSSDTGAFINWYGIPSTLTFTLDGNYNISNFSLWNDRGTVNCGVRDFKLSFFNEDNEEIQTGYSGQASLPTDGSSPTPQVFNFASVFEGVNLIEFEIQNNWPSSFGDLVQIREVEFEGSQTVPLPGAVWLLGSGLVGFMGLRRKKK